ncbi:MAG: NUDIX hydrolase [Halioglobus sp.]|nr:NUDIX hydrolase [Halioglobus sp.]
MTTIKIWKRDRADRLQRTRILDLCQASDVSPYTGKTHQFVYIDAPDWVNMVPLTADNKVVLIRQYRHGSQAVTLEIPGGMVDPGEEPSRAAVRECQEETGYRAETVHSLGRLNPNPAVFSNRLHTFVGCVTPGSAVRHVSETERTEVERVAIDDLRELLLNGVIDHTLVCATLWRFLDEWQRNGQCWSR